MAPTLLTTYIPHLDYDFQRYGPDSAQAITAAADVDAALAPLLTYAAEHAMTTVVVSEYGIEPANNPVAIVIGDLSRSSAPLVRLRSGALGAAPTSV